MSGPKKHIFPSGVDFKKSELLNARLQHLFSFPIDPEEGQIIYKSDLELGAFWNGSKWVFFGMPPNGEPYPTAADLYADQANQEVWYQYLVTGEEKIYIYLGTTTGDQTDYVVVGGGAQTLAEVLDLDNTSGPNDILFDTAQGLLFANNSRLREGTIDAGLGGTKGIAQICAVGYELKWEAGRLYVMNGDGTGIRWSLYNFTTTPTVNDDTTKGYGIGSRWVLDDGTVYACSDATTGAAVWAISGGGISDAPNDGKAYTRKSLAWAQSSPYDLKQEGATDGQVLAWSTANSRFQPTTPSGVGTPAGATTEIQYNNSGSFGASSDFTFNNSSKKLQIGNLISLSTATPVEFNMGGTFANSVTSAKAKWKFYDDGITNNIYAIGISLAQFNFFKGGAASSSEGYYWYNNNVERMRITSEVLSIPVNHLFGFIGSAAVTVNNYAISGNTTDTFINGPGASGKISFRINNTNVGQFNNNSLTLFNGINLILGTTTGTKIATVTNQKLAFWNKTPIIQPTTGIAGAARVGGGGTTITDTDTFGGYTVAQLAAILINTGLTA